MKTIKGLIAAGLAETEAARRIRRDENMSRVYAEYPELRETPSSETSQRTKWNIRDTDAILTIIPKGSGESIGTEVGIQEGILLKKPMFTAQGSEDVPEIVAWLNTLPDNLDLCVGGPRASECPEVYQITTEILSRVLDSLQHR